LKKEKGKQIFTSPFPLFKLSQVIQVVVISMLEKERFACWFLFHDFVAHFVVVVRPTTIFWSSITRSANANT
jgi:hypothetical protein